MNGISYNPEFSDVNEDAYASNVVSVTSVAVEAKAGASVLPGREAVTLTNKGPNTVYYGPSGVTVSTGDYLVKNQFVCLPIGEGISLYLICDTSKTASVVVQELA